jgi:hypothetical protein
MQVDRNRVRNYLKQLDFESLFIEELGWDTVDTVSIPLNIDGKNYSVRALAQKRSFVVYQCSPEGDSPMPDSTARRKIDRQVTLYTREHILIFTDPAAQEQVWQWVDKDSKPAKSRESRFFSTQVGNLFLQKLEALAIALEEEEQLALVSVKAKARKAFDAEKVTKKFYTQFQKQHGQFLAFIEGIQSRFDQEWYASLMLNRLMFIYFIQKEGFLADVKKGGEIVPNRDYLRDRLKQCQEQQGQDEFHSFYRYFLIKLFHDGLGSPDRTPELERLLGRVPYLNGGLFDVHQLEEANPNIQISDEAFEQIFDFFDDWDWHLDDRAHKAGNEINPDVLGYIFEKYINQKQMGAYYTKEDITEYISKNTIVPFLFDAAEKACAIAFRPESAVWQLLKDNPDRYIYPAVRYGVLLPAAPGEESQEKVFLLPPEIEAGIKDVSKRDGWNRPADAEYALPTETWREHVARRQRCLEVRQKLVSGEIHAINDLITYNLDIRQFAQDVIENCEEPELLRAFYKALAQISVLDPTCGSGAFLFAALNVLEPLYEASLERMQGFVDDLDRSAEKPHPEKFSDFRKILEQVAKHPNRDYFILKSIILNNLYGVDIMEEAVEICKLRLFLKLVSQVEADPKKDNYGLEPLPDIDFNIRAGNTLVGFATYEEVQKAVTQDQVKGKKTKETDTYFKLDLGDNMSRIAEQADIADRAFKQFRLQQTELGGRITYEDKRELRKRLKALNDELNQYLAREYGVDPKNSKAFSQWLTSHQPFHWFVEFYGNLNQGGFNVIIGNPPYVENTKIRNQYGVLSDLYSSLSCGNLYTLVLERSYQLVIRKGKSGFIIPLSLVCTKRMREIRNSLSKQRSWLSCYDMRPSSLFEGISQRLCIVVSEKSTEKVTTLFTGGYRRWSAIERQSLLNTTIYTSQTHASNSPTIIPKLSFALESSILSKISGQSLENFWDDSANPIYIHRIVRYFIKAIKFIPLFIDSNGNSGKSDDYKEFRFTLSEQNNIIALLNSSLFYWFWRNHSDGFHCGYGDVFLMPFQKDMERAERQSLTELVEELMKGLQESSAEKRISTKSGMIQYQEFSQKVTKPIIDKIDRVLAKHYGFTDEELDFIINYDIKYRMGKDVEEED